MLKAFLSSGDMIADRRADRARQYADAGEFAVAADLMEQALSLTPYWTAGWSLLGEFHEKAGAISHAISAWRSLEAHDDEGVFGAALKLAAYGAGSAGQGTAIGYVEALFDQYAPHFETALIDRLGYSVPTMLAALLSTTMLELDIARFDLGLDLGCGTGLMGDRVRSVVERLEGVDLSAAMIAECAGKGGYDALQKGELVDYLNGFEGQADLVTAADVLIYCGALPPIFVAAHKAMGKGGLLVFSLEEHEGSEPQFLRPSLRYAHSAEATRQALVAVGFEVLRLERDTLRQDRGTPIKGILIVARRL
ncbi:methyltransferase domain-containing protein [Devosia algicola]|uniref:Methyltransferase domain-containing protein n=1 Tax=Devosia algicola TaxID=3026418 RepID=A0ABY7YT30_9HYPH|nr:methyltransferase domain-containing protein [Devosia algicola]WDR04005.1 methyltransferase domain-containing protein [Devosia algicola]